MYIVVIMLLLYTYIFTIVSEHYMYNNMCSNGRNQQLAENIAIFSGIK
jgi:hypothetical protein